MQTTVELLESTASNPGGDFQPPIDPRSQSVKAARGGFRGRGSGGASERRPKGNSDRRSDRSAQKQFGEQKLDHDQVDQKGTGWTFNHLKSLNVAHWRTLEAEGAGSEAVLNAQKELLSIMPEHLSGAAAQFFQKNSEDLEESRAQYETGVPVVPEVKEYIRQVPLNEVKVPVEQSGRPDDKKQHYGKHQKKSKYQGKSNLKFDAPTSFKPSGGVEEFLDR